MLILEAYSKNDRGTVILIEIIMEYLINNVIDFLALLKCYITQ
ncbi:hypothetical protein CNEO4_580108 [Clostridium neonatale]|uniref:Uncharacterized protein n=1 Tax=Clostridium neonatale TaxID=137838 RepID=A0AA86JJJ3_9CLOT|nr:hypothetical protein CNEO_41467 [Clostridium neonatale]CAG9714452.1 hypothetical protein CNEO_90090 [Clostridium neonatale]CAG9717487.1 hypothetical protein CNEO_490029 [Clostridium neonatale]CAI3197957.1 hypothetical protein CNEO2_10165 [Clostridium neonatale]CAI3199085.1 hypothetical protein CNEO2_190088 [Clostridium neonatale]